MKRWRAGWKYNPRRYPGHTEPRRWTDRDREVAVIAGWACCDLAGVAAGFGCGVYARRTWPRQRHVLRLGAPS